MRTILSGSVRPRIGRPLSNLSHNSNALVRKPIFPAARRKLTFCDAFTILLAPVLTAAFVADLTHKDSQRQEWDQKIAQIQAEIEVLREKELQSWNALQLRSVTAGLVHQRRAYSTSAAAVHTSQEVTNNRRDVDDEDSITPSTSRSTFFPIPVEDRTVVPQDYERYVAIKVGLDLILHWRTGWHARPRWQNRWAQSDLVDAPLVSESLDMLLDRLTDINDAISSLRQEFWIKDMKEKFDIQEREQLDRTIGNMTWKCRTGNLSVPDLIYGYTRAVMTSKTGPSLTSYNRLAETFGILDADAASYLVMSSYINTSQILDDETILAVIYTYGRLRDTDSLQSLFKDLTRNRRLYRAETPWKNIFVDDVGIPVPTSYCPKLLDILIRVALQNQQPHKAQAWATVLLQHDLSPMRVVRVISNFLVYCTEHLDWKIGQFWFNLATSWASFAALNSEIPWSILISRSLELCVACEKPEIYNQILEATVTAGIEPPHVDPLRPPKLSLRVQDIRDDWIAQLKKSVIRDRESGEGPLDTALRAAKRFQLEMSKTNPSVNEFVGVVDADKLPFLRKADGEHGKPTGSQNIQFPHTSIRWVPMTSFNPSKDGPESPKSPLDSSQTPDASNAAMEGQIQRLHEQQKILQDQLKQEQDKNAALVKIHEENSRALTLEIEKLRRGKPISSDDPPETQLAMYRPFPDN